MSTAVTPILDGVPLRKRGRPRQGDRREAVKTVGLSIPPTIWDEAKRVAKEKGISISAAVSHFLVEWVDEHKQHKAA